MVHSGLYWNHHLIKHLLLTPVAAVWGCQFLSSGLHQFKRMSIFSKSPYGKEPRTLLTTKRVLLRGIAVSLSMFLLANTPVKAGPVVIRDVLQRIGSYQNPPDLLLRPVPQTPSRSASKTADTTVDPAKDSLVIVTDSESLPTGVALETIEQDPVNVVIHGDVDGTVCDCGEITVAGGWPKWPLIFLA